MKQEIVQYLCGKLLVSSGASTSEGRTEMSIDQQMVLLERSDDEDRAYRASALIERTGFSVGKRRKMKGKVVAIMWDHGLRRLDGSWKDLPYREYLIDIGHRFLVSLSKYAEDPDLDLREGETVEFSAEVFNCKEGFLIEGPLGNLVEAPPVVGVRQINGHTVRWYNHTPDLQEYVGRFTLGLCKQRINRKKLKAQRQEKD